MRTLPRKVGVVGRLSGVGSLRGGSEMSYGDEVAHWHCPEEIKETLNRYVEQKIPTGGFLEAVLCNNLSEAIGRADHINITCLPGIYRWIHWEIPSACHGSPEKVRAWLEQGKVT